MRTRETGRRGMVWYWGWGRGADIMDCVVMVVVVVVGMIGSWRLWGDGMGCGLSEVRLGSSTDRTQR